MKARILVSLVAALFTVGFSGLPISYAAAEFEWDDTAALKEHLESHVKYPATGKVIKESCKVEMPDEFAKQQRAFTGKLCAFAALSLGPGISSFFFLIFSESQPLHENHGFFNSLLGDYPDMCRALRARLRWRDALSRGQSN